MKGEVTGGVVTLQTLGVAVEQYDGALLRSTAKTLLRGAPPEGLTAKIKQILLSTPGTTIQNGVLRALDAAAKKSAKYDNLKEMMGATQRSAQPKEKSAKSAQLTANLKKLFLERQPTRRPKGGDATDAGAARAPSRSPTSEVPLEAIISSAIQELSPELLINLSLDTLSALPPESFESLSRLLVVGLWDRLVINQLPPVVSEGLLEYAGNASLFASYVEAGAGGVVGGAAAKGAFNALVTPVLGTKGIALAGAPTLGLAAKAGALAGAAAKGVALTSAFYAGRLILFSDQTPCLLYTSPSPRDQRGSRMPSSA